jgi:hypothetical protein
MNENKKCKVCEKTLPITEFFPASKYKEKQYYRGECKECTKSELRSESGQKAQKKYRNSEHGKLIRAEYKKDPDYKERQVEYFKNKRKTDPIYKAKCNIRRRLALSLKKKFWLKRSKFAEYIGCTQNELKVHLERQFTDGMTWENQGKWHIDHIIPISSAKTEEEMYKLCHYTNLQPLWAIDNIKKSNKM